MENETEVIDSTNDTETTENDASVDSGEEIDVEALKKENETLKAQKEHWRKKAEKLPEVPKEEVKPRSEGELTPADVLAFTGAGITHEDDVILAQKWARANGVTNREILKDKDFQIALNSKQEERKTAEVTQAKGGFRGAAKVTGEDLIRQAEKGKIPDSDEDIEKLAAARMNQKISELQANKR